MAVKSISGQYSLQDIGMPTRESMITVVASLDAVNDANIYPSLPGVANLAPFITNIEGVEGKRVESESLSVGFTPKGFAKNVVSPHSLKNHFTLTRQAYIASGAKFEADIQKMARERKLDPDKYVMDVTNATIDAYRDKYLKNILYYTLIRGSSMNTAIPSTNTNFYGAMGAVRGANVTNAKVGKNATAVNHWLAITDDNITDNDIKRASQLIKNFKSYSGMGIVCYGSGTTLWEVRDVLNYAQNKDVWQRTGFPVWEIAGVKFVEDEGIADGKLLFLDAGKNDIIHRMVSPAPEYRGLAIYKENAFTTFDEPAVLENAMFEIQAESYNVLNRLSLVWLDLNTKDAANGLMQAAGFEELEAFADDLLEDIYI